MIAAYIFDINLSDINAVDINEEEAIDKAQDRHNMDKRSDAIITLDINKQAAHMHSNSLAEEAMKLFDNLMKHEIYLADVESDEDVKNIVQLLDAKLEDTSKRTEPQNCELKQNKMLVILRKSVKAEITGNWMLHFQTFRDMLSCFAATGHNTYTKSWHTYL